MSKIIFFSYERMFYPKDMLSGPGARIWEMANALKRRKHKITIAQMKHEKDFTKNDIKFISWDPITLKNIGKEYDVAFIHLSAYSSDYFEKIKKIPTIVDLTTSLTMESQVHHVGNKDSFFLNDGILPTYNALQYGDFFICASEAQRNYYVGMMSIIGIKNYNIDNLEIVPYAPKSNKPIIKNKKILEKIVGKNKKILLWMGSIFSWYDYKTTLEGLKLIVKKDPNVCLVFVGGYNPYVKELTKENYLECKKYAKKLDLINKNVFFLDWVVREDLLSIYNESKLSLAISFNKVESSITHRTRIIDSFRVRTPILCTKNDAFANIIKENNLGIVIDEKNPEQFSRKVLKFIDKKDQLKRFSENIDNFVKKKFNIDESIKPVDKFCKKPIQREHKSRIDFHDIIENQKRRIKDLEYTKADKIANNNSLQTEIHRIEKLLKDVEIEKNELLKDVEIEKNEFKIETIKQVNDLKKIIQEKNKIIEEQTKILLIQKQIIGQYKSSIVYPFYRITSTIGKTKLGKLLQKILK